MSHDSEQPPPGLCRRGHAIDAANTKVKDGKRRCRTCWLEQKRRARVRNGATPRTPQPGALPADADRPWPESQAVINLAHDMGVPVSDMLDAVRRNRAKIDASRRGLTRPPEPYARAQGQGAKA